jgi:hypothetical protein
MGGQMVPKVLLEPEHAALTITIEGQEIEVQSALLSIDEIKLDPENPRIKRALKPPVTQDSIRKFLLEQPGVPDLQKQIRDNQGLIERILVNQEYLVVEGNCRAAIYRRLRDAPQSDARWQKIPTLVLPPGITDEQIAVVRAIFHVQPNKIRWGAYEQQEHLYDMATKLKMDIPRIARLLGLPEQKVQRLIEAYEAMTTYYVPSTDSSDGRRVWSYFNELYKNPGLKDFRASPKNVKLFSRLVKDKKIPRGADVRQLPNIVNDSKAFQKLQATGFKPALTLAGRTQPSQVYALFRQIRKTRLALENIKQAQLEDIQGQAGQQKELRELYRALTKVAELAKIALK